MFRRLHTNPLCWTKIDLWSKLNVFDKPIIVAGFLSSTTILSHNRKNRKDAGTSLVRLKRQNSAEAIQNDRIHSTLKYQKEYKYAKTDQLHLQTIENYWLWLWIWRHFFSIAVSVCCDEELWKLPFRLCTVVSPKRRYSIYRHRLCRHLWSYLMGVCIMRAKKTLAATSVLSTMFYTSRLAFLLQPLFLKALYWMVRVRHASKSVLEIGPYYNDTCWLLKYVSILTLHARTFAKEIKLLQPNYMLLLQLNPKIKLDSIKLHTIINSIKKVCPSQIACLCFKLFRTMYSSYRRPVCKWSVWEEHRSTDMQYTL